MKKSFPLQPYFFYIFSTNDVVDWKPKDFWEHFYFHNNVDKNEFRNQLYTGLKKLVQNGYLNMALDKSCSGIKLYTATEKANALKLCSPIYPNTIKRAPRSNSSIKENLPNETLKNEYCLLTDQLLKNQIELEYCHRLKNDYSALLKELNLQSKALKQNIIEIEIKREFLNNFLNI